MFSTLAQLRHTFRRFCRFYRSHYRFVLSLNGFETVSFVSGVAREGAGVVLPLLALRRHASAHGAPVFAGCSSFYSLHSSFPFSRFRCIHLFRRFLRLHDDVVFVFFRDAFVVVSRVASAGVGAVSQVLALQRRVCARGALRGSADVS